MSRFVTLVLFLLVATTAFGQSLDAEEVLTRVRDSVESIVDASFLLTGLLVDPDGTEIALEVEIELIPEGPVARAYIIQPDALADNFIVLDGEVVYNYLFLTNQVTVYDARDPDALGGLLGQEESQPLDLSLDLERTFEGWETVVTGYGDSPEGPAYMMTFGNLDPEALILRVEAEILDGPWIPYRLSFYDGQNGLLALLVIQDFARDQGLSPEDLTYIPEDAEFIDERGL